MQFEEVVLSAPSCEFEIEYITEEEEMSDKNVPLSTSNVNNTEETPVKRKVPVIRKPGEIVTPVHVKNAKNVKVSPSLPNTSSRPVVTARNRIEWKKVDPPMTNVSLTPAPKFVHEETTAHPELDSEPEYEAFDHEYAVGVQDETDPKPESSQQSQMDRIENKLDQIIAKLNQHDGAFKVLKYNMKDLRLELKNSVNCLKEQAGGTFDSTNAPPPKRKRLVVFPIVDDNYLLRLEELFQADDDIRAEVTMLFKEAPVTSVYEFLRKNIYALFENCSKYTWTGKPSNAMPSIPPANAACKMALVDHMITVAWEMFPNATRELIGKDFRRALGNFNDTVFTKRRKRAEMKLQKSGLLDEFDANADEKTFSSRATMNVIPTENKN